MEKKIYKCLSQPQNKEKETCPANRGQRDKANEFCTQGHTDKQQDADIREWWSQIQVQGQTCLSRTGKPAHHRGRRKKGQTSHQAWQHACNPSA